MEGHPEKQGSFQPRPVAIAHVGTCIHEAAATTPGWRVHQRNHHMNRTVCRNEITAVCGTLLCLLTLSGVLHGEDRAQEIIAKSQFTGGVVVHVHGADASLLQSMRQQSSEPARPLAGGARGRCPPGTRDACRGRTARQDQRRPVAIGDAAVHRQLRQPLDRRAG